MFATAFLAGCEKKDTSRASASETAKLPTVEPAQHSTETRMGATENDESKQRTGLERMQKNAELVLSPDRPNPVGEKLKRELEGLHPNDPEFTKRLARLWDESLAHIDERNLKSSNILEVASGIFLPTELTDHRSVNIGEDTPAAILTGVSYIAAAAREEMLVDFAKKRMNALPPTSIDLETFRILNSAIIELGPTKKISAFEPWKPLAKARNPLYRLLALRAAIRTTAQSASNLSSEDPSYNRVDGSAKLDFYLNFLDEKDPIMLAEAISAVATVPTPEARKAIENFQASQMQRGNASLLQAAADALRTQELITQSSR